MYRYDILEPGNDVRVISIRRVILMCVIAHQAVDENGEYILLDGSGDLLVRDYFRISFNKAKGVSVQTRKVRRVKTGWSKNSSNRRRHQIKTGESPAPGSEMFRRQCYETPMTRPSRSLMHVAAKAVEHNVAR